MVAFTKMHGLGNDFVVLDERADLLGLTPEQTRLIADRHRGIGCDQLISLETSAGADVFMRIRNPDGSEAGACGNATRCVASLVAAETGQRRVVVRTIAGDLPFTLMLRLYDTSVSATASALDATAIPAIAKGRCA